MKFRTDLTAERLRELFDYDSETGIFTHRADKPYPGGHAYRARAGDVAASPQAKGYLSIKVDGRNYQAHRLAFLHYYGRWPRYCVDHIDRDRGNNRIANLREASHGENRVNSKLERRNSLGVRGVYRNNRRYMAQMRVNGRLIYLGNCPPSALVRQIGWVEEGRISGSS